MRPDPARFPVRRSTNDRPPMLLGPQRYAVVRVVSRRAASGILVSSVLPCRSRAASVACKTPGTPSTAFEG